MEGPAWDLQPRGLLAGLGGRAHGRGHMRVRLDVRQSLVTLSHYALQQYGSLFVNQRVERLCTPGL